MTVIRLSVTLFVLCVTVAMVASDPPPSSSSTSPGKTIPKTPAEIAELVRQLGSGQFNKREKAQQALWRAGAAAESALRAALQDSDPEVVNRARAILDRFEWGILPDTPEAVLTQIERFRDGDDAGKRQAVAELARLGAPGRVTLSRLAMRIDVPEILAKDGQDGVANYVALVLLGDMLPQAIARWEAKSKSSNPDQAAEVLAALYRAKGDFAEARKHAAELPEILYDLAWEQGDWKALADLPSDKRQGTTALGLRAACLRLAGDTAKFEGEIAQLRKAKDPDDDWTQIKALMLNERPNEGFELLKKNGQRLAEYFDLLATQLRYKEAIALTDSIVNNDDASHTALRFRLARTLYLLGEKDRAGQLFTKVAGEYSAPAQADQLATLISTEMRFGLKAAAREHAAAYFDGLTKLAVNQDLNPVGKVLEAAFPKRGAESQTWWKHFRHTYPQEAMTATMKRVVALMDPSETGKPSAIAADLAKQLLEAQLDDDAAGHEMRARQALAAAYEAAGQLTEAEEQLAKGAAAGKSVDAWIKLGDFCLNRNRNAEAAAAYAEAVKVDRNQVLPVALEGVALQRAGRAAEGQALLDLAHAMPLGDVTARATLADALVKRDAGDAARRERDFIQKLGWARYWYAGNLLTHMAKDAANRKDFGRAADAYDRIVLGVLGNDANFIESSGYLAVPALIRAQRARASLAAGKIDDVMTQVKACQQLTPANLDLAILLTPELEKLGRKADADALYARTFGAYDAMAKDFPSSGFAHNSAAWLAACCRRDLDRALDHARKATELEPKNSGYRDTMAEVYFQRGDVVKAKELMRECIQLDPQKDYYAKQLKRFEAGDRNVPPPAEGDDD